MKEPLIGGGYILLSRKIIDSSIWNKPPLYIKVWIYLLSKAQWKGYKELKRGQLWTSMPEIQKACTYKIGYRTVTPTTKEIRDVIEWLRSPGEGNAKGSMIGTTRGTHGLLVNIHNYSIYQDSDNYEGHTEGLDEKSAKGETGAEYKRRMYKNDNTYIDHFDRFWEAYPKKVAKTAAQKAFSKLKVNEQLLSNMLSAIETQNRSRQWYDRQYIPNPATWINQQRWLDEIEDKLSETKVEMMPSGIFKLE